MEHDRVTRKLRRRDFLTLAGGSALTVLAGGALYKTLGEPGTSLAAPAPAPASIGPDVQIHLAVTDGYASLPGRVGDQTLYVFGFMEVPWASTPQDLASTYKGNVQIVSPIIALDEGQEFHLKLSNLGLAVRPDLDDAHTVHWHGFPNVIAVFDGVPMQSFAVPVGKSFTYAYVTRDPGTFIYHCHFEDVEHVQMLMIGSVYVRPVQNEGNGGSIPKARLAGGASSAPLGYTYNDGLPPTDPLSTAYDREFSLLLTEIDERPHDLLEAVQEFVWAYYEPQYWTINGRAYPDTVKPNNDPSLPHQPISSLVQANAGDRVLLRLAHLGYQQHAMEVVGIPLKVVGHDANLLRGPGGADLSYWTNVVYVAPSTTRDCLFTAPAFDAGAPVESDAYGDYNVYWLQNRNYNRQTNNGQPGLGGMVSEVRVYNGGLPAQTAGHQTFPLLSPPFP